MALGRHAGRAGTEIEPPLTWSEGVGGSQSDVGGGPRSRRGGCKTRGRFGLVCEWVRGSLFVQGFPLR